MGLVVMFQLFVALPIVAARVSPASIPVGSGTVIYATAAWAISGPVSTAHAARASAITSRATNVTDGFSRESVVLVVMFSGLMVLRPHPGWPDSSHSNAEVDL